MILTEPLGIKNSLELIELPCINKVSLGFFLHDKQIILRLVGLA